MRVVCTCVPAVGHFNPLVPLARALMEAGHDVVLVSAKSLESSATAAGLSFSAAGRSLAELRTAMFEHFPESERLPPDRQAHLLLAHVAPRALLSPLRELASDFKPDLIIHEDAEYAAPLVGVMLDIPTVVLGMPSPMRPPALLARLHVTLAEFWESAGFPPRPIGGVYQHLLIDTCPPSLQSEAVASTPSWPMRPIPYASPGNFASVADWLAHRRPGPTIHATLGTVPTCTSAVDVFEEIVRGVDRADINLIIAAGDSYGRLDPARASANVRVERFVPHDALLPFCDAVICHGGSGSTIAALSCGVPILFLLRGSASMLRNSTACDRAGASRTLREPEQVADIIRSQVDALLSDGRYRTAAVALSEEIHEMPLPIHVVPILEQMVRRFNRG